MKKVIIIISVLITTSCAKKEDWVCTCEIYAASGNSVQTKEIKNKIKTDADNECAQFGEEQAGTNGAHDCNLK
jgi:hypothetical protein